MSGFAGWSSDGGETATALKATIGSPWAGADAGSGAGQLVDGGLRVWGTVEARGKPIGVSRGNQNGTVVLGSVDVAEGAIWVTQDGNPPTDLNFAIVGNGSTTEFNSNAIVALSVLDHQGFYLYLLNGESYGAIPVTQVQRAEIFVRVALDTCTAEIEGAVAANHLFGADGGKRTQLCLCTSDGAAAPAYKWQNAVTGTLGSATVCGTE